MAVFKICFNPEKGKLIWGAEPTHPCMSKASGPEIFDTPLLQKDSISTIK